MIAGAIQHQSPDWGVWVFVGVIYALMIVLALVGRADARKRDR